MRSFEDARRLDFTHGCAAVASLALFADAAGTTPQNTAGWEFEAKAGKAGGTVRSFAVSERNDAAGTLLLTLASADVDALAAAHADDCVWHARFRTGPAAAWEPLIEAAPVRFVESLF